MVVVLCKGITHQWGNVGDVSLNVLELLREEGFLWSGYSHQGAFCANRMWTPAPGLSLTQCCVADTYNHTSTRLLTHLKPDTPRQLWTEMGCFNILKLKWTVFILVWFWTSCRKQKINSVKSHRCRNLSAFSVHIKSHCSSLFATVVQGKLLHRHCQPAKLCMLTHCATFQDDTAFSGFSFRV